MSCGVVVTLLSLEAFSQTREQPQYEVVIVNDHIFDDTGHDITRPAEFLLDSSGIVRWVNLTEDLRVRATPEEMLKAANASH